jgi:hypothetical protein
MKLHSVFQMKVPLFRPSNQHIDALRKLAESYCIQESA